VAVIVMTAFASIVLRLLTPMLSEYRTDVEQWASQLIQQPISIESIDARMDGFTPKLNLSGVELLDRNREYAIARFGGLSIHFGILSTLITGKVTFDLIELHGLDVSLIRDVEGTVSVSGLGGIKKEGGDSKDVQAEKVFGAWLMQQGRVSLYKSHIRWIDRVQQRRLDFPEVSVILKNSGNHHTIHSMFELPEEIGGELEVALDLEGDIFNKDSWGGEIYLKGEGLKSHALLTGVALQEWQLQRGIVDGEFWGEIISGELEQVQGKFLAKEVKLEYLDKSVPFSQFDTHALLKRIDSGWQLQLSRINFGGTLRGKMPRYLQFKQESDGWRLSLDQLNIDALPPLIAVVKPSLIGEASKFDGNLHDIEIYYGQGVETLRARLDSILFSGINGLPTVSGLTGRAELSGGVATLVVNSPNLGLKIPTLFKEGLPALAVTGQLSASWDKERWQLWSHQMDLNNGDLNLKLAANLQSSIASSASSQQNPHIAITSDINVTKLERLKHYIPDNLLTEGTSLWLKHAFHSGDLKEGKLLIYGRGRDIIDRSKGGRMEIALNPRAVDLQFHQEWPQIENIDADIRFSGRKMIIQSNKGEVLSTGTVDEVVVKIDDFKTPLLEVDGVARFKAEDGVRYIALSPLEKIFGKLGETVNASGEQELKLHLGIPLGHKASKVKQMVTVEGKLDFQKVALEIDETVKIDDISGVLAFNQSGVERSTLNARIFNQPLKFSIYKRRKDSQDSTFITTRSKLDSQQMLAGIDMPWVREISGQTRWNGVVEFNHTQKSALFKLDSNLKGVESRLPHPVNKVGDEKLRFDLKYQFAGKSRKQIDMTLGERLSAQIKFPKSDQTLKDIHIHLGDERLIASKHAGLLFTGKLSQLDIESWLKLLPEGGVIKGKSVFDLPVKIDMQRLHVQKNGREDSNKDKLNRRIKPSLLPPLNVNINALKYGSMQLGGVVLVTSSSRNGLKIKRLVVSDANYRMVANGTWQSGSGTKFDLKLTVKDTGKMLKSLHFNTPMTKGKLTAKGVLQWPNSPIDFKLKQVKGEFQIRGEDGVIEDIQSDAGQLLGLFSVRKVFNRIFLDFSDLKEKGLHYNELAGNFRLSRGDLYTDNFNIKSLQASMLLTGRTGIVNEDYDLSLAVIPQISDAVPVAGTLIFGPQVAVALLAFRKLFGKEFDKASMQQYRITGSWAKPNIIKIVAKPTEGGNE